MPTRSDIESWDVTHLDDAAAHWRSTAQRWESHFETIHQGMLRPGGTEWTGDAADAAAESSWADVMTVRGAGDSLHAAATVASEGAGDITWAKRQALDAITEAEVAGFTVGQDFSVRDESAGLLMRTTFARQQAAQAFADEIAARVQTLVDIDQQVATRITSALAPLEAVQFPNDHGSSDPTAQMVDYGFKQDEPKPPPPPPTRGLPPEGVHPPVEGPLTEGPPSRAREGRFGGRSLWDEHGGEWRYAPEDEHHNPHWDYNPHSTPSGRGSDWENIPIGGLPPRKSENPMISGLPPWLQNPGIQAAPTPGQNPLLAPFPGASMPAAPPVASPSPGPALMPHINIPAPNPGDLQTAGGQVAVVGGGGLLLTLLGAMALG